MIGQGDIRCYFESQREALIVFVFRGSNRNPIDLWVEFVDSTPEEEGISQWGINSQLIREIDYYCRV